MTKIEYTIEVGPVTFVICAYWNPVNGRFVPVVVQGAGEKVAAGMGGTLLFWHTKEAP